MKKQNFIVIKIMYICIISVFFNSETFSRPVDVVKAKKVAENWFKIYSTNHNQNYIFSSIYIEYYKNQPILYIFNLDPSGFIIMSTNDVIPPILAYSYKFRINISNLSEVQRHWLFVIKERIYHEIKKNQLNQKIFETWNKLEKGIYPEKKGRINNVEPLLETKYSSRWATWHPYFTGAPNDDGTNGCVPLAFSQIMKYYRFPIQGIGVKSYYWEGQTVTINFSNQNYNYDLMPFRLTYCGNGQPNCNEGSFDTIPGITQEEINEVGKLQYNVGVAVEMHWGGIGTSGSPANWMSKFQNHYGYKTTWEYYDYNYIANNPETFKSKLRQDLDEGKPVLFNFAGDNWNHSHALVIDGYENNDYFHFAMGQGGNGDAYYYLYITDDDGIHPECPYITYYRACLNIEPNCNDLPMNIELKNATINQSINKGYQARNSIIASGNNSYFIINNGANVLFVSGSSIELREGFEVKLGAQFYANIEKCGIPK